jgi:hypothetical protein
MLGPLDVSVPARRAPAGTLRAAVNVARAGPPDAPRYEVAAGAKERSGARRLLALGEQVRQRYGDLADLDADPGQSLERVLGLTDEALVVIDPGHADTPWQVRELHALEGGADATRFAQFAPVGAGHFAAVSKGAPRHDTPEAVLEVRDDAVLPLAPPPLPDVAVSSEVAAGSPDEGLEPEEYVFRFAWTLKDGTLGPPGGPVRVEVGTSGSGDTYAPVFTIDGYPYPLASEWDPILTGIAVFAQPPLLRDADGDPRDGAERPAMGNPGFRVGTISDTEIGAQAQLEGEEMPSGAASILTREPLSDESLLQHTIRAGAAFSYNQRLMLGDVGYDFARPALRRMLGWESGTDDAGGNDYWIRMKVELATSNGRFARYSEAVPLDSSHATSASFVGGLLYYPDVRAERWEIYVSSDYVPGSEPGTWGAPVMEAATRAFTTGGGNYAYARLEGTYDLTTGDPASGGGSGSGSEEVIEGMPDDDGGPRDKKIRSYAVDNRRGTSDPSDDTTHTVGRVTSTPYYDFSAVLVDDAVIDVDAYVEAHGSATEPGDSFSAMAEMTARVLDDEGTLIDKKTRAASVNQTGGSAGDGGERTFRLQAGGGARIEFDLSADAQAASAKYGDTSASGDISLRSVVVSSTGPGGGGGSSANVTGEEIAGANANEEHDPNRLLVSSVAQPRALLARRAGYIGDSPTDGIVGFAASTLPASEGQFGEYPVYALCRESVFLGQVGGGDVAFSGWRKVAPRGCVGRGAFTNLDRSVVFASVDGIYQLAPELSGEPISAPLHEGDFLESLGTGAGQASKGGGEPAAVLGYYRSVDQSRRELWVGAGALTFAFSLRHGTWTILDRERRALGRFRGRLLGTGPLSDGAGGRLYEEGASEQAQRVYMQTARLYLSAQGTWKRLREFWLRQDDPLDSLTWRLSMHDPTSGKLLLTEGTMNTVPHDAFTLPAGMLLEGELELAGEGLPGQSVERFGFEYDVRMPHRRPGTTSTDPAAPSWTTSGGVSAPLYVGATNRAPAFGSSPVTSAASGGSYTYTVEGSDPDGDAITFAISAAPAWLTLTDHGDGTATLSGTAPTVAFEEYDVTLVVSDGSKQAEQSFTLAVTGEPNLDFTKAENAAYATLLIQ